MKLSKASSYGLHALMYMVKHQTQLPVHSKIIARTEGIPNTYLARLLKRLVDAKLVANNADHDKGYCLAKPPSDINVLEIFEALEGRSLFTTCILDCSECKGGSGNCRIHQIWQQTMQPLRDTLIKTSLADIAWSHPVHRFDSNIMEYNPSRQKKDQQNQL